MSQRHTNYGGDWSRTDAITGRYRKPDVPLIVHRRELVEQDVGQLRAAAVEAQARHEQLVTAGAVWDGMDGYSFADVTDSEIEATLLNYPLISPGPRDHEPGPRSLF